MGTPPSGALNTRAVGNIAQFHTFLTVLELRHQPVVCVCVFTVWTEALIICCVSGTCDVKTFHFRRSVPCGFSTQRRGRNFIMTSGLSSCWLLAGQAREWYAQNESRLVLTEDGVTGLHGWECAGVGLSQVQLVAILHKPAAVLMMPIRWSSKRKPDQLRHFQNFWRDLVVCCMLVCESSIKCYCCVFRLFCGMAPTYLADHCQPTTMNTGNRHLWSANLGQLSVPWTRTTGALLSLVHQCGTVCLQCWDHRTLVHRRQLKTFLFSYWIMNITVAIGLTANTAHLWLSNLALYKYH